MRIGRIISVGFCIAAFVGSLARADEPTTRPVAHINHAGLLKLSWQLACQASTFHDRSNLEMVELLHSLGVHHLELAPGLAAADIDPLLARMKSVHIDVVSFGVVDPGRDEGDARQLFDLAKKLKVKTIVANPADDSLDMLDKLANEYRINVAIVNLPKPGNHWNPDDELRLMAGRSNRIGWAADVAAWGKSGLSPAQCVRKLAAHFMEVRLDGTEDPAAESDVLVEMNQQGFKGICVIGCGSGSGDELVDRFTISVNAFSEIVDELARSR